MMPIFEKSYWFDFDFLRCVLLVFVNGIFLIFAALSIERGDYNWLAEMLFDGGIYGLGLWIYRYFWPVLVWYRRVICALMIIT
jgi:hypothetical protein